MADDKKPRKTQTEIEEMLKGAAENASRNGNTGRVAREEFDIAELEKRNTQRLERAEVVEDAAAADGLIMTESEGRTQVQFPQSEDKTIVMGEKLGTNFEEQAEKELSSFFKVNLDNFSLEKERQERRVKSLVEKTQSGTLPKADDHIRDLEKSIAEGVSPIDAAKHKITLLCNELHNRDVDQQALVEELKRTSALAAYKPVIDQLADLRKILANMFGSNRQSFVSAGVPEKEIDDFLKWMKDDEEQANVAAAYAATKYFGIMPDYSAKLEQKIFQLTPFVENVAGRIRARCEELGVECKLPEKLNCDTAQSACMSTAQALDALDAYIKEERKRVPGDEDSGKFRAILEKLRPQLDKLYNENPEYAELKDENEKLAKGLEMLVVDVKDAPRINAIKRENQTLKGLAKNVNAYREAYNVVEEYIVEFEKDIKYDTDVHVKDSDKTAQLLVKGVRMMLEEVNSKQGIRTLPALR